MTDLLGLVQKAHGGLDRWREMAQLRVTASAGGVLPWPREDFLTHIVATVDTRSQRASLEPFGTPGHRGLFAPHRVEVVGPDGNVLADRDEPRRAFENHPEGALWDELQTAYFAGYAFWNYWSIPFLFAWDGFRAAEMEPWQENGETWRRLRVEFPDYVATHNSVQTFYFGADDLLLRRHDYNADIFGGIPTAHYTADHQTFGGISFPTRRWVVRRNDDDTTAPDEPRIVSLDVRSVTLS
ncbi:hypothetical protein [Streptomyces sp. NPDC058653]|uniref:hypothetical protein n=1 Tax=Streptomyces sp. NPDC058653 TaxID=3346576 RepID=UPI0036637E76